MAIILKWKPELIMNGLKIMGMKIEHLVFLDSVSFLPCALRKLPEVFGLSSSKSGYPHYFNTTEKPIHNLEDVNCPHAGVPCPATSFPNSLAQTKPRILSTIFMYYVQKKDFFLCPADMTRNTDDFVAAL